MSILASAPFAGAATTPDKGNAAVEIDGVRARALSVAYDAFREKLPEADAGNYSVKVNSKQDDQIQVSFVPGLADGEKPTLGGSTSLGRELTVWVSTSDFSVAKTAFAR